MEFWSYKSEFYHIWDNFFYMHVSIFVCGGGVRERVVCVCVCVCVYVYTWWVIQLERVYEISTFDIRFVTRKTAYQVLAKYRQNPSYVHWYLYTYNIQQHN